MGYHTFDAANADRLEDAASRYRYLSREELVAALYPTDDDVVADVGSGTGFYTDDVAPHVRTVYAVDLQEEMHAHYERKGVPANVQLVTSDVTHLPFVDDQLDAVVSTMTYHEFANEDAIDELGRVLTDDGRLVVADWSADGKGERGPPTHARCADSDATAALDAGGFEVVSARSRPETFLVVARRR